MVKIIYNGSFSALNGWILSIPTDPYIKHNYVCESAISYIQMHLQNGLVISPNDDVFNVMDKGGLSVLIHWKVIISECTSSDSTIVME